MWHGKRCVYILMYVCDIYHVSVHVIFICRYHCRVNAITRVSNQMVSANRNPPIHFQSISC